MLTIDVREKDRAVIISLCGELSFGFVEEFENIFKKYMYSDLDVIALDLKNVPYLDSFGISRIIKISRSFIGKGTGFVLINMNESIHQIFRMATFDRIFNIMTEDDFNLTYLPSSRSADFCYTEILKKGKIPCRPVREVKITQMEFVDDNGTTLVFLEDE